MVPVNQRIRRRGIYAAVRQHVFRLRPMRKHFGRVLWYVIILIFNAPARGFELWSNDIGYMDLRISSKWTSLLSKAPDDSIIYPESWSAANLWRLRGEITGRPRSFLAVGLAYEQTMRFLSGDAKNQRGVGDLYSGATIPFRIRSGDKSLVRIDDTFEYRHELDRAYMVLNLGPSECTVGRQSFGMGRGTVFTAVDIFIPFSPTEYDREWRRGIDACRVNVPVSNSFSVDLVAALGQDSDSSAICARLKGFIGVIDTEFIFARRFKDTMVAAVSSFPVLDAEVHSELSLFNTSEDLLDDSVLGDERLAVKAVIGGSYTFDYRAGIMASVEYLYSDFGLKRIEDLSGYLENDMFLARLRQGDLQTLGRHSGMARVSYGFGTEQPVTLSWIFSASDGSGLFMPAVNWSFSDEISINAYGYISLGSEPENGILTSEYGGTPTTGLLQLSFYI